MISQPQQLIFYGAPGTGKSYQVDKETKNKKVIRATIHPEYTYADFVGQMLPVPSEDGAVKFEFVPGPLTESLIEAFNDRSKEVCLVLEELSRGNVAAVFGDTFQLLDRGDDGNSRYAIFNRMIAAQIVESEENLRSLAPHEVIFPSNLSILATVNVNDQNVAPMDTAFKRRFDWRYVSSEPATKPGGGIDTSLNNPSISIITRTGKIETNWLSFYTSLNEYIVDTVSGMGRNEDRQVGQFFLSFPTKTVEDSYSDNADTKRHAEANVSSIIKNKLLQYLWQDVEGHNAGIKGKPLFARDVKSFGDLYNSFDTQQVFSDDFLDGFLKGNSARYPY